MNLGSMRTILRRRLNSPLLAGQWQDADLDVLLNEALKAIQRRYSRIDRQAQIEIYTFQISYTDQPTVGLEQVVRGHLPPGVTRGLSFGPTQIDVVVHSPQAAEFHRLVEER